MAKENGISFADAHVEVSIDGGTNWVDFSGDTNKVDVSGGERAVSEFFAMKGDSPVLTAGKKGSFEITANVVFDPVSGSPWDVLTDAYENNKPVTLRWVPAGPPGAPAAGAARFTAAGILTTPVYPGGDATSADMVVRDFTIKAAKIERDTVPAA